MALPSKLPNLVRREFEDTCTRRFFFGPSYDAYGGTAGLYDLGPGMCAMKANFLDMWRRHFIIEESMQEIDLPVVTPEEVFDASGHKARFNDIMVRDTVTGECHRLDKLLEDWCEARINDKASKPEFIPELKQLFDAVGAMSIDELKAIVEAKGVKSPKNNDLSAPFPFNLMFQTHIGPEGSKVGFLRPELAQGIILNFKRLLDTGNAQRMPYAAACIGQAFRNEIAPRAALLRVREFTLAEIEHFMNPNDKTHAKYSRVADVKVFAWDRDQQAAGAEATERTIGELHESHRIDNETLAYFIGRAVQFMNKIGIKHYRLRQHRANEMAHYAQDCWDIECLTSVGWIECVGLADRSAYDLHCHIKATKKEMAARVDYPTPKIVRVLDRKVNKGLCGKAIGKDTGAFIQRMAAMPEDECRALDAALNEGPAPVTLDCGKVVQITRELVAFAEKDEKQTGYTYVPSVIEPSFGVGRLLYCVLEQSYWVRSDDTGKNDKRAVFSFLPAMAPQKVAVLPLMMKPVLEAKARQMQEAFIAEGVSCRIDESGSAIGKKYARIDEIGIPFVVTCDFEEDGAITLRERDTAKQVRVPIDEVVGVVSQLCKPVNPALWDAITAKYPAQGAAAE